MIDHDIVRLDVAVHDTLAVAEIQGFQEFENVVTDIEVVELGVEVAEVGVVDKLEDQRRRFALRVAGLALNARGGGWLVNRLGIRTHLRIANNVEKRDDVGAACQVLENLDLSLDLLLLNGLQDLDHAFLVVDNVDAFEYFRVLSAA